MKRGSGKEFGAFSRALLVGGGGVCFPTLFPVGRQVVLCVRSRDARAGHEISFRERAAYPPRNLPGAIVLVCA